MTSTADRFGDDFGGEKMWGLKELPYPDAMSMTPQTVGWAGVAVIATGFAAWLVWRRYRRWKADEYRRVALRRLKTIATGDASAGAELPFLLRKAALCVADRHDVASLRGTDWIAWLNARSPSPSFEERDHQWLDQLAYGHEPVPHGTFERLLNTTQQWLVKHRA